MDSKVQVLLFVDPIFTSFTSLSHTELNQVKKVLDRWYLLRVWL
uniref:Uncharacterized protein n=1 Tax=Lepeophtheirus salmonis TaxID=72036 RepID=A0A0K2VKT6_LEPSM